MKDYQVRRIEAVAYGRFLRSQHKSCTVYHTLRHKYLKLYRERGQK